MNQNPTESRMRELSWRPKLSAAEEAELRAWLEQHPGAATQWAEEMALNELVQRLPDAPVPSNFTSRVMAAIERDSLTMERQQTPALPWWRRALLPRLAFAAVLVAGGLGLYQRNQMIRHERVAAPLFAVSGTKELLSVEVLEDFDAIAVIGPSVQPDTELLSLMQ